MGDQFKCFQSNVQLFKANLSTLLQKAYSFSQCSKFLAQLQLSREAHLSNVGIQSKQINSLYNESELFNTLAQYMDSQLIIDMSQR